MSAQERAQMSRLMQAVLGFIESESVRGPVSVERVRHAFPDRLATTICACVSRLGQRGFIVRTSHGHWLPNGQEVIPDDVLEQAKLNVHPLVQQVANVAMRLEVARLMKERSP